MEVLIRASYSILGHEVKNLTEQQARDLVGYKFGLEEAEPIVENMRLYPVHCFHLAKIAGDREMRELFRQSDRQFEDLFCISDHSPPLKPV